MQLIPVQHLSIYENHKTTKEHMANIFEPCILNTKRNNYENTNDLLSMISIEQKSFTCNMQIAKMSRI